MENLPELQSTGGTVKFVNDIIGIHKVLNDLIHVIRFNLACILPYVLLPLCFLVFHKREKRSGCNSSTGDRGMGFRLVYLKRKLEVPAKSRTDLRAASRFMSSRIILFSYSSPSKLFLEAVTIVKLSLFAIAGF